ncbi:MAG: hypothetical protein SCK28_02105 [Bacillota bacterium]|nr:hypothetical protein [Bacillota bacterium]
MTDHDYEHSEKKSYPFFAKLPIIILNLLFLFPLGLYFMWKYKRFNKPARIIITIIILFFFAHATLKRQGII